MTCTSLHEAVGLLESIEKKMYAYNHAMSLIGVDGNTVAPKAGVEGRGITLGVLGELAYSLSTDRENIALAEYILQNAPKDDLALRRRAELLKKTAEKNARIPADEYIAFTVLTNEAQDVWAKAKNTNDFSLFAPYLEKIVAFNRKLAGYYDASLPPYDALLNEFEEGLTAKTLDTFFATLRSEIVPLMKKVAQSAPIDISFLRRSYPIEAQRRFSDVLMELIGIDRDRCTIGETEHPFTDGFSNRDVRITTHYHENAPDDSMFSVIHEGGHAIYELDGDDAFNYTLLCGGASMSMHESQSRFYENIIGRSRAFCSVLFPRMQKIFPGQLADVTEDMFYRAINRAEPSLIRTQADELTYALHIMVRYEIEKELVGGTLPVCDVPARWNALYKEYLGIDVPSDTEGCLQDCHWAGGMLGYFPSYALGSAYAAQMLDTMEACLGDVFADVERGDLSKIRGWLKENIHRYGQLYKPGELLERACGPFDASHYTNYLKKKFSALYGFEA